MADSGVQLLRANHAWSVVDAAISLVAADDPVELARRSYVAGKRARDDPQPEVDACGWSSAILERNLVLRRRRNQVCSSSWCHLTFLVGKKQGESEEKLEENRCSEEAVVVDKGDDGKDHWSSEVAEEKAVADSAGGEFGAEEAWSIAFLRGVV